MRWIPLTLLTLGIVLAGLPAASASATADGILTGTVAYHESSPDRTLEVYREGADGTWSADDSLSTTVATNGRYTVQVPAGEDVKVRVSFGSPYYGYWYGDVFHPDYARTVQAAAGQTVTLDDIQVPIPVSYSGRLLDRGGNPVAGRVVPTVNTDGASSPIIPEPIPVDESGEYQVFLPARGGGVYESGVIGFAESGDWAWLGGGTENEPNYYLNPLAGESRTGQDITLPIGSESVAPDTTHPSTTTLRATRTPVVRGAIRKGHKLRSTAGSYNKRPTTVRYQWLRNGKAIRGATTSTYKLKKADVRKHIRVRVTAYSSGAKVSATSARTAAVRAR